MRGTSSETFSVWQLNARRCHLKLELLSKAIFALQLIPVSQKCVCDEAVHCRFSVLDAYWRGLHK